MWQSLVDQLNNHCIDVFGGHNKIVLTKDAYRKALKGVFDNNYLSIDAGTGAQISSSTPVLSTMTSELPSNITTYYLEINDERFKIIDHEPDSENMTKLILKRVKNV